MSRLHRPNYTQFPNSILDNLPSFSDAELRILLCITRHTYGWQRSEAIISISQMEKVTGMSRPGVVAPVKSLLSQNFIGRRAVGDAFSYFVLFDQEVTPLPGGGQPDLPDPVNGVDSPPVNGVNPLYKEKILKKDLKKRVQTQPPLLTVENSRAKGSLDQVKAFAVEMGLPDSDAEWFFWKCEGNAWKNGNGPIKDWKATIRAWKAAGYLPSQKNIKATRPTASVQPRISARDF